MKKLLALLLALVMCVSLLASCESEKKSKGEDDDELEEKLEELEEQLEEMGELEAEIKELEEKLKNADSEDDIEEIKKELEEKLEDLENLEAEETEAVTTETVAEENPESSAALADTIVVSVGTYPDTLDPAFNSAVDGATYIVHTFTGLIGYDANGNLAPMCAAEIPEGVALPNGMVSYTFTLRDGLKWSDGEQLTAYDFEYAWKRAALWDNYADYGYMFEVIDGYYNDDLNVTAHDEKTLEVILTTDVPYFIELCAFPTYMPVREDIVERYGESWAMYADTYIGNGPYKVTEFTYSELVLEKNEHYFDADSVVTNEIVFKFNGDADSLLSKYKRGSYHFIDEVPYYEMDDLAANYPYEYCVEGQLGTYYINFNVNDPALNGFTEGEREDIRRALALLIDREYVGDEIGRAWQVPATGFVAMGITEPDGCEYISRNGPDRDGTGYYSDDYEANCAEALSLLEGVAESSGLYSYSNGKVYGFPTLTYITNEGTGHEAIAAYLREVWGNYGITITVEVQEWSIFLNARKSGNYSVARNGWLADYNDPLTFLDMWVTYSGNNDAQLGKGTHASYAGYDGKTWAESYDAIIAEIKACKNAEERYELMHKAEDMLMQTGAICPFYYYTDVYMCKQELEGFFSSPLGYKYFMYSYVE